MNSTDRAPAHRKDIDGLRAVAVLAVILFHFGCLPNGFLGVDIFFVISGYLITGIIHRELRDGRFSMKNFYMRRTRRIIPLAIVVSGVALVLGTVTMLPDDMENLAQSVIASNFFANNILQAVTTRNYWDVVNEYKPLMHTWSLGVEEQYYLLYPPLLWLIGSRRPGWMLPSLAVMTAASLTLAFSPFQDYVKFYMLPFRLYELAAGGMAAILFKDRQLDHRPSPLLVALLVVLVSVQIPFLSHDATLLIAVIATTGLLVTRNGDSRASKLFLENRLMVGLGLISFSLYMWHQILLAYARYVAFGNLKPVHLIAIFVLTVALSVASYALIETPARDKRRVNTRGLLTTLGVLYLLVNGSALYVYTKAGVLRNIPELDIVASQSSRGMHARYNERILTLDRDFESRNKVRVLVIGNSFARDWANVLLESRYGQQIEISYIADAGTDTRLRQRAAMADSIFYSTPPDRDVVESQGIDLSKVHAVGTKSFGASNGVFYNYRGPDYYQQRTLPESGSLESNAQMRREWQGRFFDYYEKVLDAQGSVPVFTPSEKFISQDCRHLTAAGARYFAGLFEADLAKVIDSP